MSELPRQLVPGDDYSLWPQMKWTRGRQIFSDFASRVDLYSTSVPTGFTVTYEEARRVAVFRARIPHPAPIYEWSLVLADAIHNYRTALDALAWELAHLDGATPSAVAASKIYFPLCVNEQQWQRQTVGPLATVPAEMLERLYQLQPFHHEPVEEGVGRILHRLDIADKHKAMVRAEVLSRSPHQFQWRIELESGRNADDIRIEWISSGETLHDQDPVARLVATEPISVAKSSMPLPMSLLIEDLGARHDVFDLMQKIDFQVGATFQLIETGRIENEGEVGQEFGP